MVCDLASAPHGSFGRRLGVCRGGVRGERRPCPPLVGEGREAAVWGVPSVCAPTSPFRFLPQCLLFNIIFQP